MATIIGTIGKDFLNGTNAADTIKGLAGNDVINGLNGLDKIFGGVGNDILRGGAGPDQLHGGAGSDWTSYVGAPGGVGVDLRTGLGTAGHANGDTYDSIENVRGTAVGDLIAGNHGNNIIEGLGGGDQIGGFGGDDIIRSGGGGDLLAGGSGNDIIDPGAGGDIIDGGTGLDTVDYSKTNAAVQVNLQLSTSGGGAIGDGYADVENVVGTKFADTLTPGAGGTAVGGPGNDTLTTPIDGVVTLIGGGGQDTLNGSTAFSSVEHFQLQYNRGWDTIAKFWRTDGDKLLVDHREFGLGSELDPAQLLNLAVGPPVANINSGQFIFIDFTNTLFFDRDGTGGQFAALKIATIEINGGAITPVVADFLLI